jgi:ribonuclease HI
VRSLSENVKIMSFIKVYDEIIEASQTWKARERLTHTVVGKIKVFWIPSHSGIEGNELADLKTKKKELIYLWKKT